MIKNRIDIIYKNVDELIPYVNNPRHNENAVDAVASSIKNFGFKQPIVIDNKNEIVAGHTRLLASKKLGLEEVPVIIADDLSEGQIRAYRLADNKVSELSEWDYNMLGLELEEIDIDMTDFGFDEITIDDFNEEFELNNNEEPNTKQITFYFSNKQFDLIESALDMISLSDGDITEEGSVKGNKLYKLVSEWVEVQKI